MKKQTRSSLIILGFCLFASLACQTSCASWVSWSNAKTLQGDNQVPKGWIAHQDPTGFSVQFPRGWQARTDRNTGRVELQGQEGEQLCVWPIFIPNQTRQNVTNMTAEASAFGKQTASSVLQKFAANLWPNAAWEMPQAAGPASVRMRGRLGDRPALAIFTWVNSPKGSAGYVYTIAAPEARYRQSEDTFAKILQSFQLVGAPAPPQEPAPTYVKWQDPRENAFSLDAPSQWRMQGGLFRFASVDTRAAWETISPDGQTRITGGDAELPPFTLPSQLLAMGGFPEGSWYSPGYGVRLMVKRYIPGTAFAQSYVTSKVASGCTDLTFTETRDRPDAVQSLNAIYAQSGLAVKLTAGEVAFTCRKNGQLMQGYYFAGTQLVQSPGGGIWNVEHLFGYLATSGKAAQAQTVLERMVQSVAVNPQWAAMQQNITANTSQIVSRTNREISNIITSSYWKRQGVMDELSRRRSNATLGVEDVVDRTTGRQIKVESGSNYYWIDQRGTIVGTQTETRPNLDFRELTRLP